MLQWKSILITFGRLARHSLAAEACLTLAEAEACLTLANKQVVRQDQVKLSGTDSESKLFNIEKLSSLTVHPVGPVLATLNSFAP